MFPFLASSILFTLQALTIAGVKNVFTIQLDSNLDYLNVGQGTLATTITTSTHFQELSIAYSIQREKDVCVGLRERQSKQMKERDRENDGLSSSKSKDLMYLNIRVCLGDRYVCQCLREIDRNMSVSVRVRHTSISVRDTQIKIRLIESECRVCV